MGRELRRVPLDFQWPLHQPWRGYLNPFGDASKECPHCRGYGYSPEGKRLYDQWYGQARFRPQDRGSRPWTADDAPVLAMARRNVERSPDYYGTGETAVWTEAQRLCALFNTQWSHHLNDDDVAALIAEGRLMDFTHTWSPETRWQPKEPAYVPTAAEVNAWSLSGLGHDSINAWVVVKAECRRLGVSSTCAHCEGEGSLWPSEEARHAYETWERTDPPAGEGYQMWETVSEGSPISPVFATPEALAQWLVGNRQGSVDEGTTYEQWLSFIRGPGWAPSFVGTASGELLSGVVASAQESHADGR